MLEVLHGQRELDGHSLLRLQGNCPESSQGLLRKAAGPARIGCWLHGGQYQQGDLIRGHAPCKPQVTRVGIVMM